MSRFNRDIFFAFYTTVDTNSALFYQEELEKIIILCV